MNSIRSTERSLKQIALCTTNITGRKARATPYIKTFDLLLGRKNGRPFNSLSSRTFKIRLHDDLKTAETRLMSTSSTAPTIENTAIEKPKPVEVAFFNPLKPSFDKSNSQVLESIIPKSLARFPKGEIDIPSVTKVLSATMPAASLYILERWKEAMIKKLGTEGFSIYQKETFERGRLLHALLANYLMGQGEPVDGQAELTKQVVSNLWKSIQNVIKTKISNVRLVEHIVSYPALNYRGIVDCVAFYDSELVVIDFKTAEKPKKGVDSLYDNPLQVSAYCGAINNDANIPQSVIDRNIAAAVIIVAYVDGSDATVHYLSAEQVLNNYWKQWIKRLDQFNRLEEQKQKQNSKPKPKTK